MPRGAPDYGLYAVKTAPIVGLADLGEAVARLGAINVWDRRGFTVFQDNFESPTLDYYCYASAPGVIPVLSNTQVLTGSQSVYFSAPAAEDSASHMARDFALLKEGKLGVELWVQAVTRAPGYFYYSFYIYDGAIPAYAKVMFDSIAKTITLNTDEGDVVVATNIFTRQSYHYFLPIKVVIDTNTDKYVRLMVGSQEIDVSAYKLTTFAPSTDRYIHLGIGVVGDDVATMKAYLDNLILTQDEPA